MNAVLADAMAAFARKDWPSLAALVRAFDDPESRFVAAWCQVETGQVEAGLGQIRQVFRAVAGRLDFTPRTKWGLWAFRKRFGASRLVEWGIHDELIAQLWLELTQLPLPLSVNRDFAEQWVNPWLFAFMNSLHPEARPPVPWQLGGAGALADDVGWAGVTAWAERVTRPHRLAKPRRVHVDPLFVQWLTGQFSPAPSQQLELCSQLAHLLQRVVPDQALRRLGEEFDQQLLLDELRPKVPEAARERLARVVFQVTPTRALDAAIVQLNVGSPPGGGGGARGRH